MIFGGAVIVSFLAMFIIGLSLDLKVFSEEFNKFDKKFIAIIISQVLMVPLITILLTEFFFDLEEYAKLFLVILSLAPGATLSIAFVTLNKGNIYLSVKINVLIALLSIVTLPLVLKLYLSINISNIQIDIAKSIFQLLIIIGVPVVLGSIIRTYFKPFSDTIIRKLFIIIFIGLYGLAFAEMSHEWPGVNYLLSALPAMTILIVLYIVFSTIICFSFQLSGPNYRTVIIETFMQNIPLVTSITLLLFPNDPILMLGAIWAFLQFIIGLIFYIYLRKTSILRIF